MNRAIRLRSLVHVMFVAGSLALVHCSGGGSESTGMTDDDVTSNFTLLVSASAARSSAVPLSGASLSGNEYIFTSDSTKSATPAGIKSVSYWLDNTAMTGAATHVENFAPYDYIGSAGDGSAEALDVSKLSKGTHTITQSVTPTTGAAQVSTATFTVGTTSTGGGDAGGGSGGSTACPSNATLLSSFGSAGTGSDDTATIQRAINSTASTKQVLRVQSTSKGYILGPVSVPSNASVCFDSGVKVTARSGWGQFDRMFTIDRVSNVSITGYGATFTMPPSYYATDSDPEYRHFVSVTGSSNVRVAGMTANTFGGDTLYVGSTGTTVSSNVTFEDITSNGHTRDGLTVIAVNGGFFRRLHLDSGHVAVDMEPNVATDSMINVHLEDSESTGNKYGGVNVSTYAYTSSSQPISITILRHTDTNSAAGDTSGDFHKGTSFSANGTNGVALGGTLLFDSCKSVRAGSRAAWAAWWTANGPNVTYKNLTIIDPNQNKTAVDNAAVTLGRGGGGEGNQGNAYWLGTNISSSDHKIDYYFTFYDGSGFGYTNTKFDSTGTMSGAAKAPPNGLFEGAGVSSVNK